MFLFLVFLFWSMKDRRRGEKVENTRNKDEIWGERNRENNFWSECLVIAILSNSFENMTAFVPCSWLQFSAHLIFKTVLLIETQFKAHLKKNTYRKQEFLEWRFGILYFAWPWQKAIQSLFHAVQATFHELFAIP